MKKDEYVIEYSETVQQQIKRDINGREYVDADLDGAVIYLNGCNIRILYDRDEVWFDILTMAEILQLPADEISEYSREKQDWSASAGRYYVTIDFLVRFYEDKYSGPKKKIQKELLEKFMIWDLGFRAAVTLLGDDDE